MGGVSESNRYKDSFKPSRGLFEAFLKLITHNSLVVSEILPDKQENLTNTIYNRLAVSILKDSTGTLGWWV